MPGYIRDQWRRAARPHRCGLCTATIARGDRHHVSTNEYDGRIYDFRTCQHCKADRVMTWVWDWCHQPDEGVSDEDVLEWATDVHHYSSSGAERAAARGVLARCVGGEGE